MPNFMVTSPDGRKFRITAPEGTTKEQALARFQSEMQAAPASSPAKSAITAPPEPSPEYVDPVQAQIAEGLGVSPAQVDLNRSLPWTTRVGMGLLSDRPEEQMAFLQQRFPESQVARAGEYFGILSPQGQVTVANPPGLDWGDVAQFVGEAGPATAGALGGGAAALATGFTGPGALMTGAATGAATAEGVRELLQGVAGTQRETAGQYLPRAAISGAVEFLPGAGRGIRNAWRYLRGRGENELAQTISKLSDDELGQMITQLRDDGINIPELMNMQKFDNPLLEKIARQSIQFSKKAQDRLQQQLIDLGKATKSIVPKEGPVSNPDEVMQLLAARRHQATLPQLAEPTIAGEATIEAVEAGKGARKSAMREGYKLVDETADLEKPVFDLSGTISAAKESIKQGYSIDEPGVVIDVFGQTLRQGDVDNMVRVDEPAKKLSRINQILSQLDPLQDNWQVVSEIRSQLGRILDMPLAKREEAGGEIAQARALYRQLSDDLMGVQNAPRFQEAITNATAKAKSYYDTYDIPAVKSALSAKEGQSPEQLWDVIAGNPTQWPVAFREVIQEAQGSPQALGTVKQNLEQAIIGSKKPWDVIQKWQSKNPRALQWLFGDERGLARASQNARTLQELATGRGAEAADAAFARTGFAQNIIKERAQKRLARGITPEANMRQLAREYGPEGRQALRSSAVSDIIEKGLLEHDKTGTLVPNAKALGKAIRTAEKTGVWQGLLTSRDRVALETMRRFARKAWKSGDAGTGLAVASQIGQLRGGDWQAYANARFSSLLGDLVTRTDIPTSQLFSRIPKDQTLFRNPYATRVYTALRQGYLAPEITEAVTEPEPQPEQLGLPPVLY